MHGDKVRCRKDVVERSDGHAECLCPLLVDVRIVRNDIHIKGECALCDAAADAPHADDAECLAAQLHADVCLAVPLSCVHGRIRRRNLACEREHHRHRMLRRGNRVAARRVDDNDAALRRRLHVNVVYTDACASDNLKFIGARQYIRRHLRGRTHHERIIIADDLHELLVRDLVTHIDLILCQ